jgi:hypothetical protein
VGKVGKELLGTELDGKFDSMLEGVELTGIRGDWLLLGWLVVGALVGVRVVGKYGSISI